LRIDFLKKQILILTTIIFILIFGVVPVSGSPVIKYSGTTIRIGFDPNLPPYQYFEDDEYKGFNIDLITKIANDNFFDIQLMPMPLSQCVESFKNKEIDIILGIRYMPELDEIMDFSDSLVQSTISLITLKEKEKHIKDILNIEPFIISVERGSAEYEFVKNIKKANYNLAFNQESAIELLLMGRADMMIGVRHVAEFTFEKYNLSDKYVISNAYETPVDYYLGITKDYPGLLNIINTNLRDLKISGEYEEIYNNWINDKNLENQKKLIRYFTIAAISAVSILLAAVFINLQLKRRVNEKTKELSDANKKLEDNILEIRQSNDLKNLIIESSPRSIVIFDNEGKIILMNEVSLKLCGCKKTLIGESVYEIPPINIMLENNIDKVLNNGESYLGEELEYKIEEKNYVFRYVIYPLFDYEKRTKGAIITIEDITDEKILRAQAEEKEKNRALAQIISGIAHEIRNPLTSIKTYVELIPKKMSNLQFQEHIATVVPQEVERVNKLIEQLIDYAKPRTKNVETIKISELINFCTILFQPVLKRSEIKLSYNVEDDLYIKADNNQIKQVMINFILNAIDAINEIKEEMNIIREYKIELSAYSIDSMVYISVKDNGIGMSEEETKNVFELFYTTKSNGSGIGLPLSKQIVEENEGLIQLYSKKNEGTNILIAFKGVKYEK
jgi:polar amino acid transport system substrate-binding protein